MPLMNLKEEQSDESLGDVLPKEVINRLRTSDGQSLYLIEAPDGSYQLTPYDPAFANKMRKADGIIDRYRNTFHVLSK